MELTEAAAFAELRALLISEGSEGDWKAPAHPAFERLRRAIHGGPRPSMADFAVLIRHALRFETLRRGPDAPVAEVSVMPGPFSEFLDWKLFGLSAFADSSQLRLRATAWRPSWLEMGPSESADAWACSEQKRRTFLSEPSEDPVLSLLQLPGYRSRLQRSAVWASTRMPPGATLLITLATGEGKSLIPYVIARAGFEVSRGSNAAEGVTLVVVPTVALAIDQENAAHERGFGGTLAYRAGEKASNATLRQKIGEGSQAICFASPEAICGPLRGALGQCATSGKLRAIVVDEAHLVDAWGTGFRTEFQLLGGLRRELIHLSPRNAQPRTILLTATLTSSARKTLRTLFSEEHNFRESDGAALRLEPEFWVAKQSPPEERKARVLEAIRHLPRPLILYVTKVADAIAWGEVLVQQGHRRLRVVHGKTPTSDRDKTLARWRDGDVDIVVATSAFGLGIDYSHVRAVVHACLPESLDRFYQEVGRGGRDGRACVSMLIPAHGDESVARRISSAKVIGIERGRQRWNAMFQSSHQGPVDKTFDVRLNIAPGTDEDDIDMVGERSADWSARTLALMERAGLLQLMGGEVRGDAFDPWQTVRILDQEHLTEKTWQRRVEPTRSEIAKSSAHNIQKMLEFASDRGCASRNFIDVYGSSRVGSGCSSCRTCRVNPTMRAAPTSVQGGFPWEALEIDTSTRMLLDSGGRLVVLYDEQTISPRFKRRMGEALEALGKRGFINLWMLGADAAAWSAVVQEIATGPWSVAKGSRIVPGRLPPGPEVIVGTAGSKLTQLNLSERPKGQERVLILPSQTISPDRPEVPLRVRHSGRIMRFDEFHRNLMQ